MDAAELRDRRRQAHTEHIMNKLGVHSRAEIAVWVERSRR
jgi:DNA-binding CsgD family transcriptional regulator